MTGTVDSEVGLVSLTEEMAGVGLLYIHTEQVSLYGKSEVYRTERLGQQVGHGTDRQD